LKLLQHSLKKYKVSKVIWVFDAPVSNSGRMKTKLIDYAKEKEHNWEVVLLNNPDKFIANSEFIGVSSDAWILDKIKLWSNIIEIIIPKDYPSLITCE
jgi:hypothetical protein